MRTVEPLADLCKLERSVVRHADGTTRMPTSLEPHRAGARSA